MAQVLRIEWVKELNMHKTDGLNCGKPKISSTTYPEVQGRNRLISNTRTDQAQDGFRELLGIIKENFGSGPWTRRQVFWSNL